MAKRTFEELPRPLREGLRDYEARLRARFGRRLRQAALFGSWARGDEHRDSDVDVLVVIDGADWREEREAAMLSADTGLALDVWLSPAIYSTERLNYLLAIENPFARSATADSIPL